MKAGTRNPCEEKSVGRIGGPSKYQLLLRTSNPPGLVYMGKMLANEGGARLTIQSRLDLWRIIGQVVSHFYEAYC